MRMLSDKELQDLRENNRRIREGFAALALTQGPKLRAAFDEFRKAMARVRIDLGPLHAKK